LEEKARGRHGADDFGSSFSAPGTRPGGRWNLGRENKHDNASIVSTIRRPDLSRENILRQAANRSDTCRRAYRPKAEVSRPSHYRRLSRRAKFFAIFSLPSGPRARKSEQNRSVRKRAGVFTQAGPKGDVRADATTVRCNPVNGHSVSRGLMLTAIDIGQAGSR
jgi:hypothetical protein